MNIKEYAIKVDTTECKLTGGLSLPNIDEYKTLFTELTEAIANCTTDTYTINLRELHFINSSGVTSLARVIMTAKTKNKNITLVGSSTSSWHEKTFKTFCRLWGAIKYRYE